MSPTKITSTTPQNQADDAEPKGKPGIVDRLKARLEEIRARVRFVDHAMSAFEHYSAAQASMLSGAVTYFGLLSFFPILALAFAGIAIAVRITDDERVRERVLEALQGVLPGLFNQIDTEQIASAATAASIIGIAGFLYSGLGWLSALRGALQTMFAVPKTERGNFVIGKVFDLITLATLGLVLVVSVGSTSVVTSLTGSFLDAVGLAEVPGMKFVVWLVGIGLGVLASTLLFFVIFRLLGRPDLPGRALRHGAVFSAIGFEALKLLATLLIGSTVDNPIYGPFALVIALLVWINYFARVTMLGASWAATTPPADEVVVERQAQEAEQVLGELRPGHHLVPNRSSVTDLPERDRGALVTGMVLGAAAVGLAVSLRRAAEEER